MYIWREHWISGLDLQAPAVRHESWVMPEAAVSMAANSSALQKNQELLLLYMTNDFNLVVALSCACQNFVHIIISFLGKGRNNYFTA